MIINWNDSPVQLITGPRKCGKSEYMEKTLSTYTDRLYVGTLWKAPLYEKALSIHRERRDSQWKLVESTGDIQHDQNHIQSAIDQMNGSGYILMDGLTTWAIHCARINGDLLGCSRSVVHTLEHLIHSNKKARWTLIDVRPIDFNTDEQQVQRHACSQLHCLLKRFVPEINLIEWKEDFNGKLSGSMG